MTHKDAPVPTPIDLMTVAQLVSFTGLSRSTVYRLAKSGLPRYRRPGDPKTYVSWAEFESATAFYRVQD